MCGADYTGIGHYDKEEMATNEAGEQYVRGSGTTNGEATYKRDMDVLQLIIDNAPKGKKLRVMEMGAGRGGMARNITKGLIEKDLLEICVATNISDVENNYNEEQGKVYGDKYQVKKISFDNLFGEGAFKEGDNFDVILCCDSLLHSKDKAKMARDVNKLLNKDGILYISDLLQNADSPAESRKAIQDRFGNKMYVNMGTRAEYEEVLEKDGGLTKKYARYQTDQMKRHYGLMRYRATTDCKEELLGPNGVTPEDYEKRVKGLDVWIKLLAEAHIEWGEFLYEKK